MYYLVINFATTLCCFLFLLFLFISYFSKKNMNNLENIIYRWLLIFNALCIISYLIFYSFDLFANYSPDPMKYYNIARILAYFGPLFVIWWFVFILLYVFIITSENNEKLNIFFKKNSNNILIFMFIIIFILSLIHFLEHIDIDITTTIENTPFLTFNAVLIVAVFLSPIVIIVNRKSINKRKALPIYSLAAIMIFALFFGIFGIKIVFVHILITAISQLMYYTIENPDVQLITELQFAKTQAEQANNAKSDFLSSMSHELRTPLNAIVGLSQMIITSEDVNDMHEDGKDILEASNNLISIVDGILDFNMIESNNMELVESNYNTNEFFNAIVDLIRPEVESKKLEFKYNISDTIPRELIGDKNKIKTIVYNLLNNAVKYTESGFVELSVDCIIKEDICTLKINVSDSGKGIKEEDVSNIFEKFYRSNDDKDSNITGTGLGLAITKSLIDLMNGKIVVNSNEGIGSSFYVTLSQKIVRNNDNEIL